jgi:hypothetical protein
MRTVRRLYLYVVAFVSLEVVIWGTIWLARSMFCSGNALCPGGAILAQGLALLLVGLPVFAIHWALAERFAAREEEERSSGIRAVFLYGTLLATLIPIVQNSLSLFDRLALQAVGLSPAQAILGPNQTWSDNLIAMLMNAIAAVYFYVKLKKDWGMITTQTRFADIRRIYRHIWLLYGLAMVIGAVQQLLRFLLCIYPNIFANLFRASGAHGVVLALVGVPLWVYSWLTVSRALAVKEERESRLHLGVLYLLSLAGVITVLASAGIVVDILLRLIFGEALSFSALIEQIAPPLSILIPLAGVWAYYGRRLGSAIAESADAPQRAGMRRLYLYILSAIGIGATIMGLSMLLTFVIDAALGRFIGQDVLRARMAAALATLLASLPLWLLTWRPLQAEAVAAGDAGDHARRSIIRKVYLYLALFAAVVGGMIVAADLFTTLLKTALGSHPDDFLKVVLDKVELLLLFAGLGTYHGLLLGRDGKMASKALSDKQAAFPVMIIDHKEGDFSQALLTALQKQAPRLPAVFQAAGKPLPAKALPKAVLLPFALASEPPENLRKWLSRYRGLRLAVPHVAEDTGSDLSNAWICTAPVGSLSEAAGQAAQFVRQLAEGQEIQQKPARSGWMIFVYIMAGFFGLELLFALISLSISLISR